MHRADIKFRRRRAKGLVNKNDEGHLEEVTVSCHNADDGCKEKITYQATPGWRPLRKLCMTCIEHGTPSTRTNIKGDGHYRGNVPVAGEGLFFRGPISDIVQITAFPRRGGR